MTKQEIINSIQHGDLQRVAEIIRTRHLVDVSRSAVHYWLYKGGERSKIESLYLQAFAEVIEQRKQQLLITGQ